MKKIEWILPIKLISEANNTDHWTKKRKRNKNQEKIIWWQWNQVQPDITLPCIVTLTRIAPRFLDQDDNLRMSFKHVKDIIADLIKPGLAMGRADDDERMIWQYSQEKGKPKEYAVKIEIVSLYLKVQ